MMAKQNMQTNECVISTYKLRQVDLLKYFILFFNHSLLSIPFLTSFIYTAKWPEHCALYRVALRLSPKPIWPHNAVISALLTTFPMLQTTFLWLFCNYQFVLPIPFTFSLPHHVLWKTVWRFLKKLKIYLSFDLAIPFVGLYPKKTKTRNQKTVRNPMFIASLFTVAKIGSSQSVPWQVSG